MAVGEIPVDGYLLLAGVRATGGRSVEARRGADHLP